MTHVSPPVSCIPLSSEQLQAFCRTWHIQRLWVFGSMTRGDFSSTSDLDLLAEFAPEARWTLLDLAAAEEEISRLVGRPVDLVDRQALEQSQNWIRRQQILESAQLLYMAG